MNYSMPSQNAYYANSTLQPYDTQTQNLSYAAVEENEQHWSHNLQVPNLSQALIAAVSATERRERRRPKYTRSRNGCLVCRSKKVKCDEAKPSCQRCVNSNRECSWPLPTTDPAKRAAPRRKSLPDELSVETSSDVSADFETSNDIFADAPDEHNMLLHSTDSLYLKSYPSPEAAQYPLLSSAQQSVISASEYNRDRYAQVAGLPSRVNDNSLLPGHIESSTYKLTADAHVSAVNMTNRSILSASDTRSRSQTYQVDQTNYQTSQNTYPLPKAEQRNNTYGTTNSAPPHYSSISQNHYPTRGTAISRSCRTSLSSGLNMNYINPPVPGSHPSSRSSTASSASSTNGYMIDSSGRWIPTPQSAPASVANRFPYNDAYHQYAQGPSRSSWMQ